MIRIGNRHKKFLAVMEELHDYLGELNDLVIGPEVLSEHHIKGKLPSAGRHERNCLLDRAEDCYDRLIAAKRFW